MNQPVITEKAHVLPPVLPPANRRPPEALTAEVGMMLASYIHGYNQIGAIYRQPDLLAGKVKTIMIGVEANLFAMRYGREYFSAHQFREAQLAELESERYVVGIDGDEHYHVRKLQKDGYARSMLDDRCPEMVDIVRNLTDQHKPGEMFTVFPFMQQIATHQLGAAILNHATPERWQEICLWVQSMLQAAFAAKYMTEDRRAAYQTAKVNSMALADEIIEAHKCPVDHGRDTNHRNLVTDLLAATEREPDLFTEQDLRISVLTPYIAGINPVAHTCTYMLYMLLQQPDTLRAVVDEVDAAFASDAPSPTMIRKLEMLRCAMLEALRLCPFAPFLEMNAIQPFDFTGHHVKQDTPVVIAITAPHFMPEYFPEPFRFNVERYQEAQGGHRTPGAFVPYGVGHHICLGAGFAEAQMLLMMAAILHHLELALPADAPKPMIGVPGRNPYQVRVVKQRH